jgi:hypothetical protein
LKKFSAENIEACEPVNELLNKLISLGFSIDKSKASDYHFNEVYFSLKPNKDIDSEKIKDFSINNIERISNKKFCCKCHWSIVEIEQ